MRFFSKRTDVYSELRESYSTSNRVCYNSSFFSWHGRGILGWFKRRDFAFSTNRIPVSLLDWNLFFYFFYGKTKKRIACRLSYTSHNWFRHFITTWYVVSAIANIPLCFVLIVPVEKTWIDKAKAIQRLNCDISTLSLPCNWSLSLQR